MKVGAGGPGIDGARFDGEVAAKALGDSPQAAIDNISQLVEIGFREVTRYSDWQTPADYHRRMKWLAQHVLPAFS